MKSGRAKVLSWQVGGVCLGIVILLAALVEQPVSISSQFVTLAGYIWGTFDADLVTSSADAASGYVSTNAYLDKDGGLYAENVADPSTYMIVFAVAMVAGSALSGLLRGGIDKSERVMPAIWRRNFGDAPWKRYLAAFVAGLVVLFGARLAGGCTSGHMMSGMMQTAVSGYVFAIGAFLGGIPAAVYLFHRET